MLKFCLCKEVFGSLGAFEEMRDLVKKKVLTVGEVRLLIESDIILFYNDLISYFNFNGRSMIGTGAILSREIFYSYIEQHQKDRPKYYKFLQILKQNQLLGVSSLGYTIEQEPLALSNEQYQVLMTVLWDKVS